MAVPCMELAYDLEQSVTHWTSKEGEIHAVFLVSDTHFGHAGVCRFTESDGVTKILSLTVMKWMKKWLKRWNDTVRSNDKVYHLGDVVINRKYRSMARLNGDKVLIRGNHDIFPDDEYRKYFLNYEHIML
jgi:calcineurin-like phosphoesterase family protein